MLGSSPSGSRVTRRWGWSWRPWKNTYLISLFWGLLIYLLLHIWMNTESCGGQQGDRRWDGWMASLTQWTWVWASCGRWWRVGKPGMLQVHEVSKSWTPLSAWTTARKNLEDIMLSEIRLYDSIHMRCQNSGIHRDRKKNDGYQQLGQGGTGVIL